MAIIYALAHYDDALLILPRPNHEFLHSKILLDFLKELSVDSTHSNGLFIVPVLKKSFGFNYDTQTEFRTDFAESSC